MALGIVFALFIPLAVIGAIAGVVFVAVKGGQGFSFHNLLRGYLRVAYFVSLVVFLVGSTMALTALFATAFGHDFSYDRNGGACYSNVGKPYPAGAYPTPPPGPPACDANNDPRQTDDLIRGVSLIVAGLVIGGAHRFGQAAMETAEERRSSLLSKIESIVGTAAFGIASIIFIPLGAYGLLRYLVLVNHGVDQYRSGDTPGAAVAAALVFLPAWLYYLTTFVRRARASRTDSPGARRPAQAFRIRTHYPLRYHSGRNTRCWPVPSWGTPDEVPILWSPGPQGGRLA